MDEVIAVETKTESLSIIVSQRLTISKRKEKKRKRTIASHELGNQKGS